MGTSHVTRILVTGGDGILATALRPYFPLATYTSHSACDVTNAAQVRQVFQAVQPELVIHCAAVTSHNAPAGAYTMGNVMGTIHVTLAARKCGARLVYPSTDYLGARSEGDPIQPVNAYAASKAAAELVVRLAGDHLCLRGSWYSRLAYSHAATDAYTSKIPVDKAAFYVASLAVSEATGVVNIGGARRSIYEIALEFNPHVVPVSRTQIHCGYPIPEDCSLDTTRLRTLV